MPTPLQRRVVAVVCLTPVMQLVLRAVKGLKLLVRTVVTVHCLIVAQRRVPAHRY